MKIQATVLENGLTVVSETINHVESASLGVWIKSGSRSESSKEHGLAHMLEHMAFKGTKKRTAVKIAEEIENIGGYLNAATGLETTAYYARVLKNGVSLVIDILHDILTNSLVSEEELEREKQVIIQEIGASKDSPEDTVLFNFQAAAFRGQPLEHSIMGTPEAVTSFKSKDLKNFLKNHYHGPNMILSCAGAVEHKELLDLVAKPFSEFSSTALKKADSASYVGGENMEKRNLLETQIIIGFEGRTYQGSEFYTSKLLASIIGGGMSSRLFQEAREKRGLCYSIHAFHWGFSDTGTFAIHTATTPNKVKELIPIIIKEIKKSTELIKTEEIERAKTQIRANLLMSNESPVDRSAQNARQILLSGRIIANEELMQRIENISPERVKNLANKIFLESTPTITAVGSTEHVYTQKEVLELLKNA